MTEVLLIAIGFPVFGLLLMGLAQYLDVQRDRRSEIAETYRIIRLFRSPKTLIPVINRFGDFVQIDGNLRVWMIQRRLRKAHALEGEHRKARNGRMWTYALLSGAFVHLCFHFFLGSTIGKAAFVASLVAYVLSLVEIFNYYFNKEIWQEAEEDVRDRVFTLDTQTFVTGEENDV